MAWTTAARPRPTLTPPSPRPHPPKSPLQPFPSAYDPFPAPAPGANVVGGLLAGLEPGRWRRSCRGRWDSGNRHAALDAAASPCRGKRPFARRKRPAEPSPPPPRPPAGAPLGLRLLLDGSALEIFTSTGETLTTRVYRGHPPEAAAAAAAAGGGGDSGEGSEGEAAGCGVCLFAAGAPCVVASVEAYEMASCWRDVCGAAAGAPDSEPGAPGAAPPGGAAAAPAPAPEAAAAAAPAGEEVQQQDDDEPAAPAAVRRAFLHELHITE
jgi:hypothetical protein